MYKENNHHTNQLYVLSDSGKFYVQHMYIENHRYILKLLYCIWLVEMT